LLELLDLSGLVIDVLGQLRTHSALGGSGASDTLFEAGLLQQLLLMLNFLQNPPAIAGIDRRPLNSTIAQLRIGIVCTV
jgi:hypothetical protein